MEKKFEVKDLAIIISDDKYGERALSFLKEFTVVKFNSGEVLTSKERMNIIKKYKDMHSKDNLIFVIKDNRMYIDMYHEGDLSMYKYFMGNATIYNSIREFLLCAEEWIIKQKTFDK